MICKGTNFFNNFMQISEKIIKTVAKCYNTKKIGIIHSCMMPIKRSNINGAARAPRNYFSNFFTITVAL